MRSTLSLLLVLAMLALVEASTRAQQPKKIPRIGWISLFGRNSPNASAFVGRKGPNITAFIEGLRERGYFEGQNIIIEYRSGEGRENRLSEIATELVRLKVDIIVTDTNAATRAAKKATATIPVVFIYGDPVWDGLVSSLARPGGNLTGLSIIAPQLAGKRLELLKEVVPNISRVAILLDPDASVHRGQFAEIQTLATALSIQLQALELRDSTLDFESLFQKAISHRANALLTLPNPTVSFHRKRVLDLAAKSRLPAMYPDSRFADSGGLISYGPNLPDLYRRAAFYVDKILKGAKPADLPVEQPTKFELVINLKTAKTLGLTIPSKVLMWADRVISDGGQMAEKSVATTTYSSDAKRSAKIPCIGILSPGSSGGPALEAFRQKLRELGYVEGQNVAFKYRWASAKEDRFPELAEELLSLKVDVIVAGSTQAALAAQKLTKTIPIILTNSADPIASGLVASLARPGGNITGLSFMAPDLTSKGLELLKETFPGITKVAVLGRGRLPGTVTGYREKVGVTARALGVELLMLNVQEISEIENGFSEIRKKGANAFTLLSHPFFTQNAAHILHLAARSRIPAMYPHRNFVENGGLMSYGPIHSDLHRRAAYFVDKILKGAKPADLPVEQATKFELVINLKTAKEIGLTIPPKVLMWADKVIR